MDLHSILTFVGVGLLGLGALSGFALFWRAVVARDKEAAGQGTLWGLFLLGLIGGILLLVWAYSVR